MGAAASDPSVHWGPPPFISHQRSDVTLSSLLSRSRDSEPHGAYRIFLGFGLSQNADVSLEPKPQTLNPKPYLLFSPRWRRIAHAAQKAVTARWCLWWGCGCVPFSPEATQRRPVCGFSPLWGRKHRALVSTYVSLGRQQKQRVSGTVLNARKQSPSRSPRSL